MPKVGPERAHRVRAPDVVVPEDVDGLVGVGGEVVEPLELLAGRRGHRPAPADRGVEHGEDGTGQVDPLGGLGREVGGAVDVVVAPGVHQAVAEGLAVELEEVAVLARRCPRR